MDMRSLELRALPAQRIEGFSVLLASAQRHSMIASMQMWG